MRGLFRFFDVHIIGRGARKSRGARTDVRIGASGDAQTLASFGVAGKTVRAFDGDANSGITGSAEPTERVIDGADTVGAGGAFTGAGGGVGANTGRAGRQGAGIRAGTIAIDEALDRGARALLAGFSGTAVGVVAAIAGGADGRARGVCTADCSVGAIVLAADANIAGNVARAGFQSAIGHRATRAGAAGNAAIGIRVRAAAKLIGGAAKIAIETGAEVRGRAAQVFAIAVSGAALTVAAFGISGVRRVEMGMAAMIAADLAAGNVGSIGADIATAVLGRASPGANRVLATGLCNGIETAAVGFDQRFDTDSSLGSKRLHHLRGSGGSRWLAWLTQGFGGPRRSAEHRRGQTITDGSTAHNRRTGAEKTAQERAPVLSGGHGPGETIEGLLVHRWVPKPTVG